MKIFAKAALFAVLCALCLPAPRGYSEASWLIDEPAFHISAHGQTSCSECHEDASKRGPHPNPANVTKNILVSFSKENCIQCHEEVDKDLARAIHGKSHVADPAVYDACINCHDPHTQLSLSAVREGKVDPGVPPVSQCANCHDERKSLPKPDKAQENCLSCHRAPVQGKSGAEDAVTDLCFYCHADGGPASKITPSARMPILSMEQYLKTPHAGSSCLSCHPEAAAYEHAGQKRADCSTCHNPHDEKVAHDAHITVSCEACHLPGIAPVKHKERGEILWKKPEGAKSTASHIHEMIKEEGTESCRRCHYDGNNLGAAAWILPPKGILCMPCHAATFSVSDTFTILGLGLFLAGLIIAFSYVFSSSDKEPSRLKSNNGDETHQGTGHRKSGRLSASLKAIALDVFLQRRLFARSLGRWLIHGLVFYAFFFRSLWGIVALVASLLDPPWEAFRFMLDKNNPATGMFFDISGLMILLGLSLMLVRGLLTPRLPGLPAQDRLALGLIGALVIIGFVTEGLRIAMTGFPEGSDWSFAGYGIGLIFSDSQKLSGVYGYLWYIHAALTAAFVAYIPFSRLFHIIISPAVLALGALKRH